MVEALKKVYRLLNKVLISSVGVKLAPAGSITLSNGSIDRLLYFGELFKRLEQVEGSVVECGVSGGTSFVALCILAIYLVGYPDNIYRIENGVALLEKKDILALPGKG